MKQEFTAVFEREGDRYIAYCPEIPGPNGQGKTKEEARPRAGPRGTTKRFCATTFRMHAWRWTSRSPPRSVGHSPGSREEER